MDKLTKAFWLFELAGFLVIIFLLFLYPAYLSTQSQITGKASSYRSGYYDPNTDEIVILDEENSFEYFLTMRHELCHRRQNEQGTLSDWSAIFFDELECYVSQWSGILDWAKHRMGEK